MFAKSDHNDVTYFLMRANREATAYLNTDDMRLTLVCLRYDKLKLIAHPTGPLPAQSSVCTWKAGLHLKASPNSHKLRAGLEKMLDAVRRAK